MENGTILRREFTELSDLAAQLQGMTAEAVPLTPGLYAGALSTFDLGDVTLQVIRSAPLLMLGAPAAGEIGLIQAFEGAERARWNGQPVKSSHIAICDSGRRHEAIYPDAFACMLLSCKTPQANATLVPGEFAVSEDGGAADILHADPEALSTLAAAARAVEQSGVHPSPALLAAEARAALRATMLDAVRGLLVPPGIGARAHNRDGRTRQRIVHEADEYLRANPARPVYTDELCAALCVSATRLHQAFSATFGISPHRYLKLRRMSMVRAALLSRAGPWRSVKGVALSHGFWHLGQFAHDYRALYGEAPSETLGRACPHATSPGDAGEARF